MCQICGKPVDRSEPHVTIVWSLESHDRDGIHPTLAEDLILFHNEHAPTFAAFQARIAY
jgi:hypothetical protein